MICQRNFILIFLPKKQHFYDKKTPFRDFIPNFVKRGKQIALKKTQKNLLMLSILIPTCNFDCSALVEALWLQAEALRKKREGEFDFEIIVSDDASSNRQVLESLETVARAHQEVHILYQPTRLGRAANRNVLIQQSRMPWLLFIDSDAEVCTPDFIARYWEARHSADVVCGSLRVGEWRKGAELRYRYEKRASTVSAAERNSDPYMKFTTFNVMMKREVTDEVTFEDSCKGYGHEDTLFGLDLRSASKTVVHIDNPLIHTGLDSNEAFLQKCVEALHALHGLPQLQQYVGASRVFLLLQRCHLVPALRFSAKVLVPLIRRNLLSNHPSLLLLYIFKLLEYARLAEEK